MRVIGTVIHFPDILLGCSSATPSFLFDKCSESAWPFRVSSAFYQRIDSRP
ncbi:MAG: hypothetical protein QOJ04_6507, partial [Caballeronia sp.]|nr:hypothetical protein [Caballeronia sp.]